MKIKPKFDVEKNIKPEQMTYLKIKMFFIALNLGGGGGGGISKANSWLELQKCLKSGINLC